MNLFAAALNTETNTFSTFETRVNDFFCVHRSEVVSDPQCIEGLGPLSTWKAMCRESGHDFSPGLFAYAQPSGTVAGEAYEALRDELLSDLDASRPVDIVLLDLHGAMVAEGYPDCEGDLIERVRERVGPGVVIGVELDLHCHLTPAMVEYADIIVTYKEYPHTDICARAREVFDLALRTKQGEITPVLSVFDCRMMGMYPTTSEPMAAFVSRMREAEQADGILSVSLGHGFPWGDVAEAGTRMLVIADDDRSLAERTAQRLGMAFHGLRESVQMVSLRLETALQRAMDSPRSPVIVADQSDNPGGGAPGDSTYALHWLHRNRLGRAAVAIVYDPEVVGAARSTGPGGRVDIRLGGKLSGHSGAPLRVEAEVLGIRTNYHHRFPQQQGEDISFPIGDTVALRCGAVDVIVSSERTQCFSPCVLTDFGLDPQQYQAIVVKSTQHFRAAFAEIAEEIVYMSAPGAIPPIMTLIPYEKMPTCDKYPWVAEPFGESRTTSSRELAHEY